ncbi:MAG TPA: hypothetical protein VGC74_15880 [Stenotrophomonas sp.]|jgi:hypothetical protein
MNWINRLKSSFGSKGREAGLTTVDLASINHTMPTVAADCLTFVMPTEASFEGAPQFHEDEWCQIEFLPQDGLDAIQATLTRYKAFESAHRLQYGWSEVFARQLPRAVLIEGANAVERIAELFGTTPINAPILSVTSRPLGQVEGGFAIRPSTDVLLYGLADERGITALGAILDGDDMQLSHAFATLHSAARLVLVDWRGQLALCGVGADGRYAAWRP